jgi:sucrose phosphorylase
MKNQVQLITYVDRFGARDLHGLQALLEGPLRGVFGGVHLLPFFHPIDGADAGFDPIDHTRVDPRLGTWEELKHLTATVEVMGDVIVNHVSAHSPQFRDYLARGASSAYAGMFLTRESVFPHGATAAQLAAIYRPRPGRPFTEVKLANGEKQQFWTTFTPEQIDIDVQHPQGRAYLTRILRTFADNGIRMVRLDAVGYAIKKAGTSCFMLPETFEFIAGFAQQASDLGIEVLVEIHSYYRRQIEIAARVGWVYDFALPPLLLHALAFRTARFLKDWIRIRPGNALTVLDTHDGIGIIDIGADAADRAGSPGLVPPAELDQLVEIIHQRTGGESRRATGAAASNLDLYQVNCTYYDAMGRDERRYLLARAIQFFLPGVPQVYYVGLLAGRNDMALLARSGVGRDINRHYYTRTEVETELQRPVVVVLLELIRLRNAHPAFAGNFELGTTPDDHLQLSWSRGRDYAQLEANLSDGSWRLRASRLGGADPEYICTDESVLQR